MSAIESVHPCSAEQSRPKHLTRKDSGNLLRRALCNTGVSQAEVARAWGVKRPTVHHVIYGRKPLTAEREAKLPTLVYDEYHRLKAQDRGDRAWVRLPDVESREASHEALAEYVRDTAETAEAALRLLAKPGCEQQKREVAREFREDLEKAAAMLAALEGSE